MEDNAPVIVAKENNQSHTLVRMIVHGVYVLLLLVCMGGGAWLYQHMQRSQQVLNSRIAELKHEIEAQNQMIAQQHTQFNQSLGELKKQNIWIMQHSHDKPASGVYAGMLAHYWLQVTEHLAQNHAPYAKVEATASQAQKAIRAMGQVAQPLMNAIQRDLESYQQSSSSNMKSVNQEWDMVAKDLLSLSSHQSLKAEKIVGQSDLHAKTSEYSVNQKDSYFSRIWQSVQKRLGTLIVVKHVPENSSGSYIVPKDGVQLLVNQAHLGLLYHSQALWSHAINDLVSILKNNQSPQASALVLRLQALEKESVLSASYFKHSLDQLYQLPPMQNTSSVTSSEHLKKDDGNQSSAQIDGVLSHEPSSAASM